MEPGGEDDDADADDAHAAGVGGLLVKWNHLQMARSGPWGYALLWGDSETLGLCTSTGAFEAACLSPYAERTPGTPTSRQHQRPPTSHQRHPLTPIVRSGLSPPRSLPSEQW